MPTRSRRWARDRTGPWTTSAWKRSAGANARLGRLDEREAAIKDLLQSQPEMCIAWFRVNFAHHAREQDLNDRLEALRLAGLYEWPYGVEGDPAHQLKGEAIDASTFGRAGGRARRRRAVRAVRRSRRHLRRAWAEHAGHRRGVPARRSAVPDVSGPQPRTLRCAARSTATRRVRRTSRTSTRT